MSVRWRTFGRHISWFPGRKWKRHGIGDHPALWVHVGRRENGQWHVVKVGLFGVALFVDRRPHFFPSEPNLLKRWVTGRVA